ncbi:ABC transporter [Subtercola sp. Z020]|uniref:ABC transporter ATP-binding protein n=1 Tax=Subtercola sp. Z020 TaxID=2080582 RepID=UPI000CE86376|nr:ABC transporter ATP-binding protein [Subtercola sp. Z020]PPF77693.1 ABC transporter [Subtercola sp. Z020]
MTTTTTTPPATGPLLQAESLSRTFGSGHSTVHACTDVNLTVNPGELVVVTGTSGAGKTTLLTMLGTLDAPDAGRVLIDGRDVASLAETELSALRRERLGFVFQTFGLLPALSAEENVEIPLRLLGTDAPSRRSAVADALAVVGLTDHAEQRPDELSGGQQQRVAIARALAASPRILIADEPTGQLDEENARLIIDVLQAISREGGRSVIVATHDPRFVERADQHLTMVDGRGVFDPR